jgi:Aspartyl protease
LPVSIPTPALTPQDDTKAIVSCPCVELRSRLKSEGAEVPLAGLRSYFRTLTAPSILAGTSPPSSLSLLPCSPSSPAVLASVTAQPPDTVAPTPSSHESDFGLPTLSSPPSLPPKSKSKEKKEKRRRATAPITDSAKSIPLPPSEPIVAEKPLTCDARFDSVDAVCLIDSGSQADVISSALAHKLGIPIQRLLAPLHADLGAEGHAVRLALFLTSSFSSGMISLPQRSFFVTPLPAGIDAILGLPWLRDTGTAASADSVFFTPDGPNEPIVDLTSQRFALQPDQNFVDLGFVNSPMSLEDQHRFAMCAMISGMADTDEFIDYEPHNPLLDIDDDDPLKPDISAEDCEEQLQVLLREFSDVLVDELPEDRPAPFRPVNHRIPLVDPGQHV